MFVRKKEHDVLEHRHGAVAVMHVGRLRGEDQGAALRVHQGLELAPFTF